MSKILENVNELVTRSDDLDGGDDYVPPERFMLQAELIRRQVEHELDGDSEDPLIYFFKADDYVSPHDIEQFAEALSTHKSEAFVYRGSFEHKSEDEMREIIKKVAPEVGLSVEEVDDD